MTRSGAAGWGTGSYERTAAQLEPAADAVVSAAAPRAGERVLDLACGTGNAALRVARLGISVHGVDLAPRLIGVATERARELEVDAGFAVGDVTALDLPDGSFDVALSVFGIIFAAPPERVASEIVRVLRRGGRAIFSAWLPTGPIYASGMALRRRLASAGSLEPTPIDWSDAATIAALFAGAGTVRWSDRELVFGDRSPEAWVEDMREHHPIWIMGREAITDPGEWNEFEAEAMTILVAGNESPAAFRSTSAYRIFEVDINR